MKNFSKTIAAFSLSLLTIGAMAQTQFQAKPTATQNTVKMKGSSKNLLKRAMPSAALHYAYLDYRLADSIVTAEINGGTYLNWYGQILNSRYAIADTGSPLSNQSLLHSVAVAFDTLYDVASLTGYPQHGLSNMTVDTIQVLMGHQNTSGTNDTIVIQINGVTNGLPNTTVLYSHTIITDTGLSPNNSWNYIYPVLLAPNLILTGTQFAISLHYYGSKLDTFGFLYGFPSFTCSSSSLADTTLFGISPISTMYPIRANSFSTGWSYFAAAPYTDTFTFPNAADGEGIYYPCTQNGLLYWQDIGMQAIVSFNSTLGINNIAASGLSVGQNYPNPFNKETTINYSLTKSSDVTFTVYDVTGRVIANNNYGNVAPGQYNINLNANTFSPGIYFYTFNVNGSIVTKKMVITN